MKLVYLFTGLRCYSNWLQIQTLQLRQPCNIRTPTWSHQHTLDNMAEWDGAEYRVFHYYDSRYGEGSPTAIALVEKPTGQRLVSFKAWGQWAPWDGTWQHNGHGSALPSFRATIGELFRHSNQSILITFHCRANREAKWAAVEVYSSEGILFGGVCLSDPPNLRGHRPRRILMGLCTWGIYANGGRPCEVGCILEHPQVFICRDPSRAS